MRLKKGTSKPRHSLYLDIYLDQVMFPANEIRSPSQGTGHEQARGVRGHLRSLRVGGGIAGIGIHHHREA